MLSTCCVVTSEFCGYIPKIYFPYIAIIYLLIKLYCSVYIGVGSHFHNHMFKIFNYAHWEIINWKIV